MIYGVINDEVLNDTNDVGHVDYPIEFNLNEGVCLICFKGVCLILPPSDTNDVGHLKCSMKLICMRVYVSYWIIHNYIIDVVIKDEVLVFLVILMMPDI